VYGNVEIQQLLSLQSFVSNLFELTAEAMAERALRTQLIEQRLGLIEGFHAHITLEQLPPASRNLSLS
jgi:hypothetical protein